MTNDTTTLNGALAELGETIADNLVTMGVTDADPSDGLTTLANKILDIAPVPPTPAPASIDLTSNKSILSYADSESASLTATVYDSSDNPLSGQTVSMKVYKASDDSLLETLTVTDVGDGTYTASYLGKGTGDLYIKAECSLVSVTYEIEDCYFYDSFTSDNSRFTLVQGSATLEYSSNGLKYNGTSSSGDTYHKLNYDLPNSDYSIEYIVTDATTSSYCAEICVEDTRLGWNSGDGINCYKISGGTVFNSHTNYSVPNTIRIEVTGTSTKTIKWYKDNTLLGTGTNITQNKLFRLKTYLNRRIQIKDLKIKPL